MKRFYREAGFVTAHDAGYQIVLDDKPVQTPARSPLIVPTPALARAIVQEWRAQEDKIRPESMPLTRLAGTAIDRIMPRRDAVIEDLARYGETDMLCYRVDQPPALAERQMALWQPVLAWAETDLGIELAATSNILPLAQDPAVIDRLRAVIAGYDSMTLMPLHAVTTLAGSILLGLAAVEGARAAEAIWQASMVEELYQAEQWGEDTEARDRRSALRRNLEEALVFRRLLLDTAKL